MDEFIKKINPETFTLNVLVCLVVVAAIMFVFFLWWPWYRDKYFPAKEDRRKQEFAARMEAEKEQNGIIRSILNTQVEIATLVKQALNEIQAHDLWTRNYVQAGAERASQSEVGRILAEPKK